MAQQRSWWIGNRREWLAASGFYLLISTGCSRATGRQAIEGTVTLDGAPLTDGSILFLPSNGTKSPTSGGKITRGHFSISSVGGTYPGTFRVEIVAVRNANRKVMDPEIGKMIDEAEQFIPARYNRKSELTAKVAEQGCRGPSDSHNPINGVACHS